MSLSFSVVVTSYNYAAYVLEAIDSALAQPTAAEVIVVDDGSRDGSPARVLEAHRDDPRVQLIVKPNGGQLAAFQTGVAAARHDLIAFLDADDVWEPDYLARVGACYQRPGLIDFVYTNLGYFDQRTGLLSKDTRTRDLGLSILLGAFQTAFQGTATSAISMRRELAVRLLDLPPAMVAGWRTRADDALVVGADILGARKFYIAEPLARYRAHGSNAWLDRRDRGADALRHWIRAQQLIDHYRDREQLSPPCIRLAKHEFMSKPTPNWSDYRSYSRLLGRSDLGWRKRLEHRGAMLRHWWRSTRGA